MERRRAQLPTQPTQQTINPPTRRLTNTTNINFDKILNAIFYLPSLPLRSRCVYRQPRITSNKQGKARKGKAKPQAFGYEREYFEYNLFSLISPFLFSLPLLPRHSYLHNRANDFIRPTTNHPLTATQKRKMLKDKVFLVLLPSPL
jgi:hypothetical protein